MRLVNLNLESFIKNKNDVIESEPSAKKYEAVQKPIKHYRRWANKQKQLDSQVDLDEGPISLHGGTINQLEEFAYFFVQLSYWGNEFSCGLNSGKWTSQQIDIGASFEYRIFPEHDQLVVAKSSSGAKWIKENAQDGC